MINTPPVLTADGDIHLHNKEGCRIPIFFSDDDGNDRDMTETTVTFETQSGFNTALTPGVAANELLLVLAPETFSELIGKATKFVVRDESVTEKPVVWAGTLLIKGW